MTLDAPPAPRATHRAAAGKRSKKQTEAQEHSVSILEEIAMRSRVEDFVENAEL